MIYDKFYAWVLAEIGLDLTAYKQSQLIRRIESLITRAKKKSIYEYQKLLEENIVERNKFIDFITINVTEFFRNAELFAELENLLKTEYFSKKKNIKVWSAACSLGCEPYSIAMMFKENGFENYTIYATDVDSTILSKAKEGIYTETEIKNMPIKYLKYFKKIKNKYILSDEIKAMVKFKKSDLILDRYERGFDLILCRNVVIYFNVDIKEKIYKKFSLSLNNNGILFVGATESIYNSELYGFKKSSTFIYRKL